MPASEVPRENYMSIVDDEPESAPVAEEGRALVNTEGEITAEEQHEGTVPGKD